MNRSSIDNHLSNDTKAKILDAFHRCLLLIIWVTLVLGSTGCQSTAVTSQASATAGPGLIPRLHRNRQTPVDSPLDRGSIASEHAATRAQ